VRRNDIKAKPDIRPNSLDFWVLEGQNQAEQRLAEACAHGNTKESGLARQDNFRIGNCIVSLPL
jgi:hypothetical protein